MVQVAAFLLPGFEHLGDREDSLHRPQNRTFNQLAINHQETGFVLLEFGDNSPGTIHGFRIR